MFNNLRHNHKFWRYLTNFWAIVVFIGVIYDFFKNNATEGILGPLIAIYIAILAIYASDKEFERWYDNHEGKHPGEIFVAAWTILMLGIIIFDVSFAKPYKIPGEVVSAYIAVLGILAVTKKSEALHKQRKMKK